MGDYTNIVTEADRETARSAVRGMRELSQGNAVEFDRQVVEYVATQLAFARESQNALHRLEFGDLLKKDVD